MNILEQHGTLKSKIYMKNKNELHQYYGQVSKYVFHSEFIPNSVNLGCLIKLNAFYVFNGTLKNILTSHLKIPNGPL